MRTATPSARTYYVINFPVLDFALLAPFLPLSHHAVSSKTHADARHGEQQRRRSVQEPAAARAERACAPARPPLIGLFLLG